MAAVKMICRLLAGAGMLMLGTTAAGCTSPGTAHTSRPAVAASPALGAVARSASVPAYTGTITIEARKGSRPHCRGPATIRLGTWYMVRQQGNAPVSFEIPGVPGASRPIPRTATYTDRDFRATKAGTYRVAISPKPVTPCQFIVK
jgi:hypothetical protein